MYNHSCEDCGSVILPDLEAHPQPLPKGGEQNDWDDIYTQIANDLLTGDVNFNADLYYKTAGKLMEAVYKGLGATYFNENDNRNDLLIAFKKNLEAFSYAKTLTQFKHFKDNMFDDKGKILSAVELKKVVADQGAIFNNRYLNVEHQFVTQSAIMAHKWDTLDSEYLEFTTVGDGKVRPEHKTFDKFTALKSDPIWKRLYTPLDWNCRCTIIPGIAKNLSKEYDSAWADKMVDPIVKDTIFDNNVGISKEIFTKKHPYFKADISKKSEFDNAVNDEKKAKLKEQRIEVREWAKENLIGKTITHPNIEKPIGFTVSGIKEALNQPHKFIIEKNDAVKNIESLIKNAEFLKTDFDYKGRDFKYHYLKTKINNEDSYIVLRETQKETSFYSIVEKLKE